MKIRSLSVETLLRQYANIASKHPFKCLFLPLILLIVLSAKLPFLQKDASIESFFDQHSEPFLSFNDFREQYGRGEFFMVLIETDDIYNSEFLSGFVALHKQIAKIPHLKSVKSLVNARSIDSSDNELIINDLLEEIPRGENDFSYLRKKINETPVYHNRLISSDHKTLAIIIEPLPLIVNYTKEGTKVVKDLDPKDLSGILHALEQKVDEHGKFSADIRVGGAASIGVLLSSAVEKDFGVFTGVSIGMLLILLVLMFRRLSGVILPLVVVGSSLMMTMGLMVWLGYPVQVTTSILPSFLMAVSVADSIHLLSHFYHSYDKGASKSEALLHAVNHSGVAMFFTSITTAAGLFAFSFASLIPVASLGILAGIGTLIAFFVTMIILPPIIRLIPIKRKMHAEGKDDLLWINKFLKQIIKLVLNFPKLIIFAAFLMAVGGIYSATQLPFSNDTLQWFDEDTSIRKTIKTADTSMAGSIPVELLIDTGTQDGALNPELWKKIDKWFVDISNKEVAGVRIGAINSMADLLKESNQALHGNKIEYYSIPETRQLIAQELLLVEMDKKDEVEAFTDDEYRYIRATIIVPWTDSIKLNALRKELVSQYEKQVNMDHVVNVTGLSVILGVVFTQMIDEIFEGYLLACLFILIIMIVLMKSLKFGLLSMLPNLIPIISILSVMLLLGLPLDMFTMLIGSIAIGLSVDDTIHFMHGFNKNLNKFGDVRKAIEETILTTGRALMITSIILVFSFLTYTLSSLNNLFNFGILTAICIVFALFADLLFAPALMLLVHQKKHL